MGFLSHSSSSCPSSNQKIACPNPDTDTIFLIFVSGDKLAVPLRIEDWWSEPYTGRHFFLTLFSRVREDCHVGFHLSSPAGQGLSAWDFHLSSSSFFELRRLQVRILNDAIDSYLCLRGEVKVALSSNRRLQLESCTAGTFSHLSRPGGQGDVIMRFHPSPAVFLEQKIAGPNPDTDASDSYLCLRVVIVTRICIISSSSSLLRIREDRVCQPVTGTIFLILKSHRCQKGQDCKLDSSSSSAVLFEPEDCRSESCNGRHSFLSLSSRVSALSKSSLLDPWLETQ
ncbi:hypothetical protein AVEN_132736-1 [Araneus ventricosus]|uniref:Uncharacterized protein n=1 Tax=Araneus ventricosus TaxID=182803 RepID=A0A4Y2PL48_ARAVE|nr:hypothetical protein AVEN_132736-1 [Araneus ventricosus]